MTWVHRGTFPLVSRPLLGVTLRGQTGARRHGVALLRLQRPCGVSVPPQKKFESRGKEHRANFFRAPPRKHSLALGSRAHFHPNAQRTRFGDPGLSLGFA